MSDDLLPALNEIMGFLNMWTSERLPELHSEFPEQAHRGYFEPGRRAGSKQTNHAASLSERVTRMRGEAQPLLVGLPIVIAKTEDALLVVRDRLQQSNSIRTWCEIIAAISSVATGSLFLANQKQGGLIVCFTSLISSLLAIWAKSRTTGVTNKSLVEVYSVLVTSIYTLQNAYGQLSHLLPNIELENIYSRVEELMKEANSTTGALNKALLEIPGLKQPAVVIENRLTR